MYGKAKQILNTIVYCSLLFTMVFIFLSNESDKRRILVLSLFFIATFPLRNFYPLWSYGRPVLMVVTYAADLVLLFYISLWDHSNITQVYFYAVVSDITLAVSTRFSIVFSLLCYLCMLFTRYLKYVRWNYFDSSYFLPLAMETTFYFLFVFFIIYIIRSQMIQSRILSDTMEKLEEVTILKERNRIAREIHDTVGHTLTTVLVEIEAGKRLIGKDSALSVNKLELAQEQVRKGLNDIRESVKTLSEGAELMAFIPSIRSLISETEKHAGVAVQCTFHSLPELPVQHQRVLYHALQEGLTNGIKHGASTRFECVFSFIDGYVQLHLEDYGIGCDRIEYGFGLKHMRAKVEELDGLFHIGPAAHQGLCLQLRLPLKKG